MNRQNHFTIIIPTRDRVDTLAKTLNATLCQEYSNFEILVSDNASCDGTAELVARLNDPRLRYLNTGKRLAMSQNWEFALAHVPDGWITVLGDDDALVPGALEKANTIINATGTLALRSVVGHYVWPSINGGRFGRLEIKLYDGYRKINSRKALARVLDGRQQYTKLPMLYNGGFINMSLVQEAKSITGSFFKSMTPDVYSAVVFALITDEYVFVDEPLALNGASHHSGGTAAFERKPRARAYDPAKKYWAEDNLPFHADLPLMPSGLPVRSIQAIVYEAYLQAEPFHDRKMLVMPKERQLEVILRSAGPDESELLGWAVQFAAAHDIKSYCANSASALLARFFYRFVKKLFRALERVGEFAVNGDERLPLKDIHEASVVAGSLKRFPPRRIALLRSSIGRLDSYTRSRR